MRRDLASALRSRTHDLAPPPPSRRSGGPGRGIARHGDEVDRLRAALREHPCHGCPDREDHARWAERWFKLDQEARPCGAGSRSAPTPSRASSTGWCEVLTSLEYLDGDNVTPRGQRLMRLYSDLDLVTAEALRTGVLDGLDTAGFAAALSVLVFEARRPDDDAPRCRAAATSEAIAELGRLAGRVPAWSGSTGSTSPRSPTSASRGRRTAGPRATTSTTCWRPGEPRLAGDFVRWMKQVIDMAGQVADAAGAGPVRDRARDAVRALRRGVVAYSASRTDLSPRARRSDAGRRCRGCSARRCLEVLGVRRAARQGRVEPASLRSRATSTTFGGDLEVVLGARIFLRGLGPCRSRGPRRRR
jgi:ATP-dependent RNA helicase HelY